MDFSYKQKASRKNPNKLVFCYVRVSSREQTINSYALEQQITWSRALGAKEISTDIKSRRKDNFSDLMIILEMIEQDEISEAADRFGRGVPILRKGNELRLVDWIRGSK